MRTFMLKVIYALYQYYYNPKRDDVPYATALGIIVLMLFVKQVIIVQGLLNTRLYPSWTSETRWIAYVVGLPILAITTWILSRIYPEKEVLAVEMSKRELFRWKAGVLSYIISMFVLVVIVALSKR